MKTTLICGFAAACFALLPLLSLPSAQAAEILSNSDFIIAIDVDPFVVNSSTPGNGNEDPLFVIDGLSGTKYLNFGILNTGFIATPFIPSSTVQSVRFTTANDFDERDPASWTLYGTNAAVPTEDHTQGNPGIWSEITSSALSLPTDRQDNSTVVNFTNSVSFDSYRVVFPTIRDINGPRGDAMQIADVQLYTGADAGGTPLFNVANDIVAIGLDLVPDSDFPSGEAPRFLLDGSMPFPETISQSASSGGEGPANIVDGTIGAKYLNQGDRDSGFIVTPDFGSSTVQSFRLSTANDFEGRDPDSYELWGTNQAIASADNSFGLGESWNLISSGDLSLPSDRDTAGPLITTGNSVDAYTSYKMIFPTIKGTNGALQFAEAEFFSTADDSGGNLLSSSDIVLAVDDTDPTKHLNFGAANSGFIVTPDAGSSTIDSFQVTTANDHEERDPLQWELYGTDDTILSEENSQGDGGEQWTLIDSGTFSTDEMPTDRSATGTLVDVNNSTEYDSYRMVFPALKDNETDPPNSLQLSGIQFFGDVITPDVDLDDDGDIDGADFLAIQRTNPSLILAWESSYGTSGVVSSTSGVPEPTTGVILLIGLLATSATGRGRASRVAAI